MRNLFMEELNFVSGAGDDDKCDSGSDDNGRSSVGNQSTLSQDIKEGYEGLIAATVYIMERVAAVF